MLHRFWVGADDTAIPSDFCFLVLNICQRPLRRDSILVFEDEYAVVLPEQSIDIFKGTVGSFGIEKVYDRNERCVQNGPDDVKLPVQRLDT